MKEMERCAVENLIKLNGGKIFATDKEWQDILGIGVSSFSKLFPKREEKAVKLRSAFEIAKRII